MRSGERKKVGEQSESGRRSTGGGGREEEGEEPDCGERRGERERQLLCKWTSKAPDWFVLFSVPLISYNRATRALTSAGERQFSSTLLLPRSKRSSESLPSTVQPRLFGVCVSRTPQSTGGCVWKTCFRGEDSRPAGSQMIPNPGSHGATRNKDSHLSFKFLPIPMHLFIARPRHIGNTCRILQNYCVNSFLIYRKKTRSKSVV